MPRPLSKNIVITSNGMMITDRDGELFVLDRDGVTLGKVLPDRVAGIRNFFSDFMGRKRVNDKRQTKVVTTGRRGGKDFTKKLAEATIKKRS